MNGDDDEWGARRDDDINDDDIADDDYTDDEDTDDGDEMFDDDDTDDDDTDDDDDDDNDEAYLRRMERDEMLRDEIKKCLARRDDAAREELEWLRWEVNSSYPRTPLSIGTTLRVARVRLPPQRGV